MFDYLGLLGMPGLTAPGKGSGTSSADAELGPGLYITDDLTTYAALRPSCNQNNLHFPSANFFANGNVVNNPGTTPQICAIFAVDSAAWRSSPKVSSEMSQ